MSLDNTFQIWNLSEFWIQKKIGQDLYWLLEVVSKHLVLNLNVI